MVWSHQNNTIYAFLLNQWAIARQEMCANILKWIYLIMANISFCHEFISYNVYIISLSIFTTRIDSCHDLFNFNTNLYTKCIFQWFTHDIKHSRGYNRMRKGESLSPKIREHHCFCVLRIRISRIKNQEEICFLKQTNFIRAADLQFPQVIILKNQIRSR